MTEQEILSEAARIRVKKRWAKTTPEERKEISRKMTEARRKKLLTARENNA